MDQLGFVARHIETGLAALLRGVWKKFEAKRAETGAPGQNPSGSGRGKPAIGERRSGAVGGSTVVSRPVLRLIVAALCGALLAPPDLSAGEWKPLSGFDADEARQMRAKLSSRSAPADGPRADRRDGWRSMGETGLSSDWVKLDEFERGTPGKRPPRLASFRLPAGSRVEQLFALISFAESPKAGYNAIHNSARQGTGKLPTQMTLGEIKSWISATPGQHHAIGRLPQRVAAAMKIFQRGPQSSQAETSHPGPHQKIFITSSSLPSSDDFAQGFPTLTRPRAERGRRGGLRHPSFWFSSRCGRWGRLRPCLR
ncbi:hypothetical protein [Ruegeria sp. HKCCD8929]|uniref:hypothetical protein n=1 Tax=Ruegeria sp. HKCCD8929 TaxID=2683006 RepID=UPI001487E722|nr:hypothetical protein [Ruegeria sp. HKCCD8929]